MSLLSVAARRSGTRGHVVPVIASTVLGAMALAAVSYLLWPTFTGSGGSTPERLPVSIGGTVFNVPTAAIRIKLQKRSGPQDRVDLDFGWPDLVPGGTARQLRPVVMEGAPQAPDLVFLSIAAHGNAMSPEERGRTIYPRYVESAGSDTPEALGMRAFRADTLYAGEDLFAGTEPAFLVRCTRDGRTPGMCLGERRVEGADLTFRFPRSFLSQWRAVAAAMDRITADLYHPR